MIVDITQESPVPEKQSAPMDISETQPLLSKTTKQVNQQSSEPQGYFLMCLSTIGFSSMSFLIHIAEQNYSFPPTSSAFIRALIHTTFATVYLAFIFPSRNLVSHLSYSQRILLVFRGIVGALDLVFLFIALRLLPVGDAITIFFSGPVFTMLLSHFVLKEPMNRLELLGALVSLTGVVLVAAPGSGPAIDPADRILGSVAALAAAILSSVAYIAVRSLGTAIHYMVSVWSFSAATIATSAAMGGAIGPAGMAEMKQGAILSVLAALFAFGGQCCLNKGLQLCRAGPGILIRNLDVPMAFILGLVFLGERPSWAGLFGSALVLLGTLLVGWLKIVRSE